MKAPEKLYRRPAIMKTAEKRPPAVALINPSADGMVSVELQRVRKLEKLDTWLALTS